MTIQDKEKLKRLTHTFDLNYRITNLYATYLEHFPTLITREMVAELCSGGDITEKEALIAIICEAFGLSDEAGGEARELIRGYVRHSVRALDTKRYTENPYYKNVKIENVKDGSWELRWETYPAYRAVICDDLIIKEDFTEIPPLGFFTEDFSFPAVLEGGNEWMTLTPVDLDTCETAIEKAHGKVITFGLGLGYYAYMCQRKAEVESITVIERSEEVIRLFNKYILPYFEHPEKLRIITADAIEYAKDGMPSENYDYAFVDVWRDASDGSPVYEKIKPLEKYSPNTEFDYWIENFLISRLRAIRFEELYKKVAENAPDAPKTYNEFIKDLTYGYTL